MDFGVVGLDNVGLVCSDNTNSFNISAAATDAASAAAASESINISKNQEKWYGSGFLKQGRSVNAPEDDLRGLKVAKFAALGDFSSSKAMQRASLLRSFATPTASAAATANNNNNINNNFFGEGQQMMLSFSSPNTQTVTLPFYHSSSNAYARNAGYDNGGLNAGSMQGVLSGVKGPFTPSQWMELEHQALIYKYIDANAPIPSHLLTPIRKALDSAGFSSFMGLRPVTYGWGGFHLGFSNSTDPEPGRCRRTDGKKWRCSRDAVADHKYCERHMNRGRHRSRKPVEGQSGHSVSGTKDISVKQPNVPTTPAAVVPGGGASNSLGLPTHQQLKNTLSSAASQSSVSAQVNRNYLDKENSGEKCQDFTGLSMISPSLSLKGNHYSIPKQSAREEFGQVCYGSLLNPLNKSSSLVNCGTYAPSQDLNQSKNKSDNGLRQLFVDWPNNQSEQTWPEMDLCSDRTQLSISIPMAAADFMSSTSSPTNEKGMSSPLRLSRDIEATHMGLGVGSYADDQSRKEANWIPISWESSMGGPLGEVLHSTNTHSAEGKIPSALSLMTDGWDGSSHVATSPTGVLQKSAFVSLSNSSAGSSPRIESNKTNEGASLCSTALGSTLINPAFHAV